MITLLAIIGWTLAGFFYLRTLSRKTKETIISSVLDKVLNQKATIVDMGEPIDLGDENH